MKVMRPVIALVLLALVFSSSFAGVDQPWNESDSSSYGTTAVALLFAVAAIWLFLENQKIETLRVRAKFDLERAQEEIRALMASVEKSEVKHATLNRRYHELQSAVQLYCDGEITDEAFDEAVKTHIV